MFKYLLDCVLNIIKNLNNLFFKKIIKISKEDNIK